MKTSTDTTRQCTGDNPRLRKHTIRTLTTQELNAVAAGEFTWSSPAE